MAAAASTRLTKSFLIRRLSMSRPSMSRPSMSRAHRSLSPILADSGVPFRFSTFSLSPRCYSSATDRKDRLLMCESCKGTGIFRSRSCMRCGGTGKIEPMIRRSPLQLYAGLMKARFADGRQCVLMGLDVGKDGVGVALTDPKVTFAFPRDLLDLNNASKTIVHHARRLRTLVDKYDVYGIVIGYPYVRDRATKQGQEIEKLVDQVSDTGILGGIPYCYGHEGLSSSAFDDLILKPYIDAIKAMVKEQGQQGLEKKLKKGQKFLKKYAMPRRLRRGARDTYAATFMVWGYLLTCEGIHDRTLVDNEGKLVQWGWKEDHELANENAKVEWEQDDSDTRVDHELANENAKVEWEQDDSDTEDSETGEDSET